MSGRVASFWPKKAFLPGFFLCSLSALRFPSFSSFLHYPSQADFWVGGAATPTFLGSMGARVSVLVVAQHFHSFEVLYPYIDRLVTHRPEQTSDPVRYVS